MSSAEEKKSDSGFPSAEITGFSAADILATKSIGALAADMVQKANSGHPGAPIGLAGVAHLLWSKYLNGNPKNPTWLNRDRFVLSNGHACALQYSMLHLTGYDLSMDDLKGFRQVGSKTPGHPEVGVTAGVEVSTGPLGQGIAQAVGLAIAQKHLAAKFNEEGFPLFDSKVYVICGDGCLQEGVSSEASSLAAHLKLDNLVLIYDDNNITIDGKTSLSFTESVTRRYKAYGWQTYVVEKGNTDFEMLGRALDAAEKSDLPTIISVQTKIGFGTSKEDTHGVHGSPLGPSVLEEYKKWLGLPSDSSFSVDSSVYELYQSTFAQRGLKKEKEWNALLEDYSKQYPSKYALLTRMMNGDLPADWRTKCLPAWDADEGTANMEPLKTDATRSVNGIVLNYLASNLEEIIGGAADLTPSTKTQLKCSGDFQRSSYDGRYLRFGVREFGMFAICNGISAFQLGMLVPFSATFLNFITYGWGAVRLGALSHLRQVYIMTHDSVWIGEDGPTHQPIETLAVCRACPNLNVFRPCDGREINAAWILTLEVDKTTPIVISLTRQKIPPIKGSNIESALKGAYVVSGGDSAAGDEAKTPDLVLIATGSEVSLAVEAASKLSADGVSVSVVSAPCLELFEKQELDYIRSVLPIGVPVMSIEAASTTGWLKFAHEAYGVDCFGASGPLKSLQSHFGFQCEDIVAKAQKLIGFSKVAFPDGKAPLLPIQYDRSTL